MSELPHLTESGDVHMVDVGDKPVTVRRATAEALVRMSEPTAALLFGGELPKGDALASARIAGIMGAKATPSLIPLCHPIHIDGAEVEIVRVPEGARISATVSTAGRTGVEMEAMTAVSIASLAVYDMVKGVERGVEIQTVRLLAKEGGRSGTWIREESDF